jgi:hypothetical protein
MSFFLHSLFNNKKFQSCFFFLFWFLHFAYLFSSKFLTLFLRISGTRGTDNAFLYFLIIHSHVPQFLITVWNRSCFKLKHAKLIILFSWNETISSLLQSWHLFLTGLVQDRQISNRNIKTRIEPQSLWLQAWAIKLLNLTSFDVFPHYWASAPIPAIKTGYFLEIFRHLRSFILILNKSMTNCLTVLAILLICILLLAIPVVFPFTLRQIIG